MLGYYDYSVILTYCSAVSAALGIMISLNGTGHPYLGIFFLMFSGLCDAFDGKVARTKKNRTNAEKKFGIQIDSMSDFLAFGVLPACIGNAMMRVSPTLPELPRFKTGTRTDFTLPILLFTILLLYVIAAMIRLSYFNVEEEMRQTKEKGERKVYRGLPVTSAALIFPSVLLVQYITSIDITLVYYAVMIIVGVLFISDIKIPKPGFRGILIMVGIGLVEFILLITLGGRGLPS